MYNYQHSFEEPEVRTGRKRAVLLVIGLFVLVLGFAAGFIVGIKFQADPQDPSERQGLQTHIQGQRPKTQDSSPEEKKDSGLKSPLQNGEVARSQESKTAPSETPSGKDLTFYQTLTTNRKQSTIGLEATQSKLKTQDPFKGKGDLNKTYTVQVGAYKEMAVAEKVMNKLKKKGYRAYIFEKAIPQQGIIYKVRAGEFPNREKAEELARGLKEKEKMDSFVTLK
jgi:cell division septation protein DedD